MELKFRKEMMSEIFEKQHIDGLPFAAVIHKFNSPDTGDAHCHPFEFDTHILYGSYVEEIYHINCYGKLSRKETVKRIAGQSHTVGAGRIHKIIDLPDGECYTLITPKKWEKEPCFYRFDGSKVFVRQWNESEFKPYKL